MTRSTAFDKIAEGLRETKDAIHALKTQGNVCCICGGELGIFLWYDRRGVFHRDCGKKSWEDSAKSNNQT